MGQIESRVISRSLASQNPAGGFRSVKCGDIGVKRNRATIAAILMLTVTGVFGQTMRIISFRATQHSIHNGDPVTLSWETSGTRSVSIDWRPLIGENKMTGGRTGLPPKGTLDDHPLVSTIYVLECASESGALCAASSVTVYVK